MTHADRRFFWAVLAAWILSGSISLAQDAGPSPATAEPYETIPLAPREAAPVADAPAGASARQIDEIVVTASRREQGVQEVVGGIQAFSGAELDAAGADSFEDYLTQVPGAGFRQDGSGNTKIGMRGVSNVSGNQLGTFSGSSPVGVYLNDVPIQGSGQLPDLDLYDLNRIEVLKGPQGTLYGEGAMGGAIRMIVNEASLTDSEFKAEGAASYTERASLNDGVKLAVGAPLIDEVLGFRVVASSKHDSGFIDLPNQQRKDANSSSRQSLRVLGKWQTSERLSTDVLYLKDLADFRGSPNVRPETRDEFESDIYEHEAGNSNIDIGGLTFKYDFDNLQLSAVSTLLNATRDSVFRLGLFKDLIEHNVADRTGPLGTFLDPALLIDLGFDAAQIQQEPFDNHTHDIGYSQELRLVSTAAERFNWVAGIYYQQREQRYVQTSFIYASPTPGENRQLNRVGKQPLKQISAYGEGTWTLREDLDATLGLRVFRETIGIVDRFETFGVLAIAQAAAGDPNPKYLDIDTTYSDILPKVSLSWRLTSEHMLYALASRGYRSTTPNVQVNLGVGPPLLAPDFLWNYELGAKTEWFDGHLRANLSLYRIDWTNLQASRTDEGRLGPVPVNVIYIDNIGDARIDGVDLETSLLLGQGFSLALSGGWQDGRLVRVDPASTAIPGSRVPASPRWSGTVSAGYSTDMFSDLSLSTSLSLQYVDDQASAETTPSNPTGSETAAYKKLSAQVSVDGSRWGLTLFGDNLLDEIIELQNASLVETEHFTTLGRPRTVGLRLRVNFGA